VVTVSTFRSSLKSPRMLAMGMVLSAFASMPALAGSPPGNPLIGKPAPELVQRLFAGPARNFRLSERRGDVVAIGFWTSWCGSCRAYLERLAKLDATYGSAGLVVVGVSLDDDAARAESLAHSVGANFRNTVDVAKVLGRRFAVADVPSLVLVDREGVVRYAHGDLDKTSEAQMTAELRQLLDE